MPLANLPNATNSPYRDPVVPGTKRARSHAGDQRELAYAQPPSKKMMLEADDDETRRHALLRKSGQNPPTALQRKLEAVRDARVDTKPLSRAAEKAQKASQENLESIRQWQRHYKKIFPQIVFYYESIPEDMRSRISRRVQTLGAVSHLFHPDGKPRTDQETARGGIFLEDSHSCCHHATNTARAHIFELQCTITAKGHSQWHY